MQVTNLDEAEAIMGSGDVDALQKIITEQREQIAQLRASSGAGPTPTSRKELNERDFTLKDAKENAMLHKLLDKYDVDQSGSYSRAEAGAIIKDLMEEKKQMKSMVQLSSNKNNIKLQQLLDEYDVDKSGTYSKAEATNIVKDLLEEEEESAQWRKYFWLLIVAFILVLAFLVLGTVIGNESTKEQHVEGGGMSKALDGLEVHTQISQQKVQIVLDSQKAIAERAKYKHDKCEGATSSCGGLVNVGTIKRALLLDGTSNVKQAARTGQAMMKKEGTKFYYDFQVRSSRDVGGGHIQIGVHVEDDNGGSSADQKKNYITIDCPADPPNGLCDITQFMDFATLQRRALSAHVGAIQLDNTDLDGVFGPQPFYHSDEGRRLAGEMSKGGGDMSAEDEETMRAQFLLGWRSGNVSNFVGSCLVAIDGTGGICDEFKNRDDCVPGAEDCGIDALYPLDHCGICRWEPTALNGTVEEIIKRYMSNAEYSSLFEDPTLLFASEYFKKSSNVSLADMDPDDAFDWFANNHRSGEFDDLFEYTYLEYSGGNTTELLNDNAMLADTRKAVFEINLKRAQEADAADSSASHGINDYADQEDAELMGMVVPASARKRRSLREDAYRWTVDQFRTRFLTTPTAIDWTDKEKNPMGIQADDPNKVVKQGKCNNCYVISAAFAVAGQVAITMKTSPPVITTQEFLQCNALHCNPGWPGDVLEEIKEKGINSKASYPYTIDSTKSVGGCQSAELPDGSLKPKDFSIASHSQATDMSETEMMAKLLDVGPYIVAVRIRSMRSYKSGIMTVDPHEGAPDHAVLLVGYGTENGIDFWKIKNSWGIGWGDKGYFRAQRGKNLLGLGSFNFWAQGGKSDNYVALQKSDPNVGAQVLQQPAQPEVHVCKHDGKWDPEDPKSIMLLCVIALLCLTLICNICGMRQREEKWPFRSSKVQNA